MDLPKQLKLLGFNNASFLGEGSSGKVFMATSLQFKNTIAVKVIQRDGKKTDRELKIASVLRHENIVHTYRVMQKANLFLIVMERISNDLSDYIVHNGRLSEEQSKKMFFQLSHAVKYMHYTARVAHRDIKCSNILMDRDFKLKLADFGISKPFENDSFTDTCLCGTITYMCPEILARVDRKYDLIKADVFSMGIVLFCMVSGKYPSRNSGDAGVDVEKIKKLRISPQGQSMMCQVLEVNPLMRFTTKKILKHDWLKKISAKLNYLY